MKFLVPFFLLLCLSHLCSAAPEAVIFERTGEHLPLENVLHNNIRDQAQLHQMLRTDCPSPYRRIAGFCLQFSFMTKLTWDDSRAYCQALDGDLAVPYSLLGQVIAYFQGTLPQFMERGCWIGARRQNPASSFQWLDGTNLPDLRSSVWNYQDIPGYDCVALKNAAAHKKIKLTNLNCTDEMPLLNQCNKC